MWNAIKANQTQPNYEQPFTVGHLLEGIGVGSDSPHDVQPAQLPFLQQFGQSQPEVRQSQLQQARLPDPPKLQIHSQGMAPSFSPAQYAAQQHQLNSGLPMQQQQQQQHQQAPPQQFSQQQYIHPAQHQHPLQQQPHQQQQQQFQQQLPAQHAQQQQQQQSSQSSMQQSQGTVRGNRSPGKARPAGKTSPDKPQSSDGVAVNIRASTQYPPAQQVHLPQQLLTYYHCLAYIRIAGLHLHACYTQGSYWGQDVF